MKPWKVRKFFEDVVYDLRSRRLLPVVILLVVAMVAVPVLLKRGSGDSSSVASVGAGSAATATPAPETEQAVITYSPGIRNYKQRLSDEAAKDPFRQQLAAPAASDNASQLRSTAPISNVTSSSGSGSSSSSSPSSPSSGGSNTGPAATKPQLFYLHSVADVSFGDVSRPLQRHKKLNNYASLPSQVAPVLIYLGSTLDQKKALFSVSRNTEQLTGDGTCVPDATDCSLLSLAPGKTEDMVYTQDGKTYRLKVNKIRLVRQDLKSRSFTK